MSRPCCSAVVCCSPFSPRALFPGILIQKHSGSFISMSLMTWNQPGNRWCSGEGDNLLPKQSQRDVDWDRQIKTSKQEWKSNGGGAVSQGCNPLAGEISPPPCGVRSGVVPCARRFPLVPVGFAAAVNSLCVL